MEIKDMNRDQLLQLITDKGLSITVTDEMTDDDVRSLIEAATDGAAGGSEGSTGSAGSAAGGSEGSDVQDIVTFDAFDGDIKDISISDAEAELTRRGARKFTSILTNIAYRQIMMNNKPIVRSIMSLRGGYPAPVKTPNGYKLGVSTTLWSFPSLTTRALAEGNPQVQIQVIKDTSTNTSEFNKILNGSIVTFWVEKVYKGEKYINPFTGIMTQEKIPRTTVYTHPVKIILSTMGMMKIQQIDNLQTQTRVKMQSKLEMAQQLLTMANRDELLDIMSKLG